MKIEGTYTPCPCCCIDRHSISSAHHLTRENLSRFSYFGHQPGIHYIQPHPRFSLPPGLRLVCNWTVYYFFIIQSRTLCVTIHTPPLLQMFYQFLSFVNFVHVNKGQISNHACMFWLPSFQTATFYISTENIDTSRGKVGKYVPVVREQNKTRMVGILL